MSAIINSRSAGLASALVARVLLLRVLPMLTGLVTDRGRVLVLLPPWRGCGACAERAARDGCAVQSAVWQAAWEGCGARGAEELARGAERAAGPQGLRAHEARRAAWTHGAWQVGEKKWQTLLSFSNRGLPVTLYKLATPE
eukprot:3799429-Rhodomonas_salina.1